MSDDLRVTTVHDPELGTIREVRDGDGTLLAEAWQSPPSADGTTVTFDEGQVFHAGGGLLPVMHALIRAENDETAPPPW